MRLPTSLVLMPLCLAAVLSACSKPQPAEEPVRAVRTVVVAAESVGQRAEFAAEVRARTESRLGFRVGGKLLKRNVDPGDAVRAGQLLAQLDPQDLKLGQEAARAALSAAEANLAVTRAEFARYSDLRRQGFISSAELERREAALKSAQSQHDQARAQVGVQGNQAAYASLSADAAGVITAVEAEPGMVVAAGTPVVRLAHDGPRDAVFSVPEDRALLMRRLQAEGTPVQVQLGGPDARTVPARIREVAAAADAATRTFLVKADLGAVAAQLGQTASVAVPLPAVADVQRLPLSALRELQGKSVVWVVEPASMTVRAQEVTLAGVEGNDALVSGGLSAGQRVVTAGVHVLNPGQKVKLYRETGAGAERAAALPGAASAAAATN